MAEILRHSISDNAYWHSGTLDRIRLASDDGMPIHAYIPMANFQFRTLVPIESPVIAYVNQMDAKRVCDRTRKKHKRVNANSTIRTSVMGITLK